MADTHAQFKVAPAIRRAVNTDSFRYALSNALVTPAGDSGGVFVTATDGRQATVYHDPEGTTDGARFLDVRCLPSASRKKPAMVEINGRCESEGKFTALPDCEAKYPDVARVINSPTCESLELTLNAQLLRTVADSIVEESDAGITLFITPPENGTSIEEPVQLVGQRGIGVIMPFAIDANRKPEATSPHHQKFCSLAMDYRSNFSNKVVND